jgi:hypothetical protein
MLFDLACSFVLVVGVVVLLWGMYFSDVRLRRRALQRAVTADPATATEGSLVKLVGTVLEEGPMLEGPLSGRPCKAYRCEVLVQVGSLGRGHTFEVPASVPFSLRDGSDVVEVRTDRVALALALDRFESAHLRGEVSARARGLLAGRGYDAEARVVSASEGVLQVGERVAVLGVARWVAAPGSGYRGSDRRLVLEAPRGGELVISDDPRTLR